MDKLQDLFIVGGGINGCGIARDAAGRGYSVELVEMNDIGSGTSSWSTKLIHGGLRYLEHYEFMLVRASLIEREVLLHLAPHLIRPIRLVLPHHQGLRPAWLLRLGLWLYDHIGGRKLLPPTSVLDLRQHPTGAALQPEYRKGFEYSDCQVDDCRLVLANALDAAERGAIIRPRCKFLRAQREQNHWLVEWQDTRSGSKGTTRARMLINATGPWVDSARAQIDGEQNYPKVRLVKGSHIVVKSLFKHDTSYILQHGDGRIVFAIPYMRDFTLIGTTDVDYQGDPADATNSPEETRYMCELISSYLREPVRPAQVVWSFSGVRPLFADVRGSAQEATRDYELQLDTEPPLLNVLGGKLTTYRKLAEEALVKIEAQLGAKGKAWSAEAALPGGDFAPMDYSQQLSKLRERYPFLSPAHAERLFQQYGSLTYDVLGDASTYQDLGQHLGHDFYESELRHMIDKEWAQTLDDVIWRRSKLGLHLDKEQCAAVEGALQQLVRGTKQFG